MNEHDCFTDGCHYEGSMFCIYCGMTAQDRCTDPDCDGCCAGNGECHRGGCDMCMPEPLYASYNPVTGQWDTIF